MLPSSEEACMRGEPNAGPSPKGTLSDEKIDMLAWLVEQLSSSVAETRHRQTRLAEVLEQSLTGISRALAESEARVQKTLDKRLSQFEKALAGLLEAEREQSEGKFREFRASLEAIERTLALSETRVEERVDERLSRFEQERGGETDASIETLGALAARLDVEAERNENTFLDLRASLEIMERNFAQLELQIAEAMKGGISLHELARKKEAENLKAAVEGLMEQGSFREAIEMHWKQKKV
jgi:hypothetical protein